MNFLQKNFEHSYKNKTFTNKVILLMLLFFSIHFAMFSQVLKDVDLITPFHEELAAIKKGDTWAFVDKQGYKVIDFRKDLVFSKTDKIWYPKFVEGKCLIKREIDGEYWYGFINKEGAIIIEPQYLNATNFTDGYAMVIKLDTSTLGTNTVLGKKMRNSKLEEYVIDASGKIIKVLDNSRGYIPSSKGVKKAPKFKSKFIAPHLAAVKNKNGKWDVYKF